MNAIKSKRSLLKAGLAACALLLASSAAMAQATVQLTAAPQTTTLPDGQSVPMWGYSCGSSTSATCSAANPGAGGNWSPVVITVPFNPSGPTSLTINLINNLPTPPGATAGIPTSIVIDGQVGGGLGSAPTRMPSPTHAPYGTTWPGTAGGTDGNAGDAVFTPPAQADRVRSFATEVAAGSSSDLTWSNLRPGTYLIHSGTQPSIQHPMGLYGVLVVTESTPTTAYGTTFDKDVALLFSEIDPAQNQAVNQAVNTTGFSDGLVWDGQTGMCGDPAVHTCYPPAVNYTPLYYLVNGASFDRTNTGASALTVPTTAASGKVLLRLVNAGLRLHVPQVVNKTLTLLAEDGNTLPGVPNVQSSVAMNAGKTYDVTIQPARSGTGANDPYSDATLAVYDRQLSLSTSNQRDGGMQTYIKVGVGAATGVGSTGSQAILAGAGNKTYYCVNGTRLSVSDPSRGLLAGVTGGNGVALVGTPTAGAVSLQANGTFTYTPPTSGECAGSFTFSVNGLATPTYTAAIANCSTSAACAGAPPVAGNGSYTSNIATRAQVAPPGLLANVTNPSGFALKAIAGTTTPGSACASVTINADGSFVATPQSPGTSCTFSYNVSTSTLRTSATDGQVTVNFLTPSNLTVNVKDAKNGGAISDYRWIIEEDKTVKVDPKCQLNVSPRPTDSYGRPCPPLPVESQGYSFHTANMPVLAQGCVGAISCEQGQTQGGTPVACDVGNGICRPAEQKATLLPGDVHLDPNKHYFISVLPGDGVNATIGGAGGPDEQGKPFSIATACGDFSPSDPRWTPGGPSSLCGHAMGGAPIKPLPVGQAIYAPVDIKLQQTPLPTAKIAVFVFQDDNPLNGENDAGGGVDVIAPNEPGLGGFEIKLFDQAGGLGDATGQITYDMFNQPVSNALANKKDPVTGLDACPINVRGGGLVGMIPTCPRYESDGKTLSPLAGQVVIANLYPGLYEIVATPAADRIALGEEWLQTNTLDGGKPHEAFIKPNEPGYFQEFGPGGYHVSIGFANPKVINDRKAGVCPTGNTNCTHTLTVKVANNHMSRTPDQRTYSTESYDHYSFTQCYVSVGPADAEDFALERCVLSEEGGKTIAKATFKNMPNGVFKLSVFDQWNDIMLDGLVGTVTVSGDTNIEFPVTQWRTNLFTRTFIDTAGTGVSDESKPGLALVNTNIHYRDGSIGFFNNTDLNGYAGFNEVFPFMNWLVVETTSTRFKPTGVHTVYDAGGPVDCSTQAGGRCTTVAANIANTDVRVPLPADLRMPGAKYCATADCLTGDAGNGLSTGTVFPPQPFGTTQGWQGLLGQNSFMEFGVKPYNPGENGGIHGQVIYASTRPFDDPALSLQLSWEPGVPRVKVNLYSKAVDASGNETLTLVDSTTTASFDDWAQGFRRDANGNLLQSAAGAGFIPNMNCPGQAIDSPFFATLKNSKQWLDADKNSLAYQSQFKCYDGWSQLNQIQPAPYDGLYKFPSVVTVGADGKPAKTNCTGCVINNAAAPGDWDYQKPMLPAGKYVVEVILPPGYELVKEEDKNILLGDVYVAPVTQQFAGFGNIFIMPDQAAVNSAYNPANPGGLNKTTNLGASPRNEGDTGSIETFWPCVGAERIVPDLNSLFPGAGQAAPFAGAKRRLCDRKEVTLDDQAAALAKFFIFSSTHIAGHFAGTITNDFASEFDPFSPQFGEKFGPPNLPVAMRDFTGNEVARIYSDQWGIYNGLYFSSYSVNPPNPTGYVPQMSIACMNDPGPILVNGQWITDPAYNAAYSNFCYETPFMPGFTAYMDTPVIPTQAFADGYNLPDTEYPDGTPAILKVTSSAVAGPWVKPASNGNSASVQLTISSVDRVTSATASNWASIQSITIGGSSVTGTTAITCNSATGQCNSNSASTRANNMAQRVVDRINSSGSGYAATRTSATNGNPISIITITAAAGTFDSLNGTALAVVSVAHLNVNPTSTTLAGGAAPANAAMDLTITALGDKVVQNPNYSGPNAATAPYNQKTITRHYGFGTCSTVSTTGTGPCSVALVGGDGVAHALTGVSWSDTTIAGTVPSDVPACAVQQRNAPASQCGELVITAGNGKQSIDAITVTIGGSAPWLVMPNDFASNTGGTVTPPPGKSMKDYTANFGRMFFSPLQTAIDSAEPGDLIIVAPGTYRENLLMWKPVRLQGVGAASVSINADAHPAGKMDQWRRQVVCAFGLDLEGIPNAGNTNFDPSGAYSCPAAMHLRTDRIPFEAITGWDASGNGNLAQVLQEPTLMGAYEGAGITVLGRGVRIPANSGAFWGNDPAAAGAFADGSVYINNTSDCSTASTSRVDGRDFGTSNFRCNPSRIDGVSVINSSQGGGVFIHGWGHSIEVANTRIWGNHGTLAGGINVGNGETPPVFLNDGTTCGAGATALCPPIPAGTPTNATIPFAFNTHVRIHHNMIYNNASIGDALFTGTPAGAGGITVSAGGDNYQIDHNWIAGNLSTGDGGGVQILGVNFNGKINNNYVLFNQTTNPTLPTNGGGIVVQGANEPRSINGAECGAATDFDCPPGLGDGTGAGLVIEANLILGNSAESGSGGGLRLQQVNGSEMIQFPTISSRWYGVTVRNNIIANNVAGWDGGGVSMEDALKVTFINNTVASNDTTASAGALFKTLGAVNASSPPPGCTNDPTQQSNLTCPTDGAGHAPQPAGLVTLAHTPNLLEAIGNLPTGPLGVRVLCPVPGGQNFGYTGNLGVNGDCMKVSKPLMINDLFWHNRAFSVDVVDPNGNIVSGTATPTGTGLLSQQNLIVVSPILNQTSTGQCAQPASAPSTFYYDVGLRTDDVSGGLISFGANKLQAYNSIVTGDPQGVLNQSNPVTASSSPFVAEYCNGARVAPEKGGAFAGYNAPPGASESTSLGTVFVFNGIKPAATVDEGHNWLNLTYGPLTLNRSAVNSSAVNAPELMIASAATGTAGGAYSIRVTSAAVNQGLNSAAPVTDFFGNSRARTSANPADVGAVECQGSGCVGASPVPIATVSPSPLAFGNWAAGTTSSTLNLTVTNTGSTPLAGLTFTFGGGPPQPFSRVSTGPFPGSAPNCGATLSVGEACTVKVQFAPATGTGGASYSQTLTVAGTGAAITPTPVTLSGTSVAARATASVLPSPLTITIATPAGNAGSGTGTVKLTNTAPVGTGAQMAVSGVAVASGTGSGLVAWFFSAEANNCSGATLAPGSSCTVGVRFTNVFSAVSTNRPGTITFTDNAGPTATGNSTQVGNLIGFANP